ncbi:MAG: AbrB/MazE/SpoVT family DNA-binding domain-containing protein [Deltaproteobacteria bacterium]|jgi:bifunctional DNA-binding transcriptional regulator/antitoxin component of YhaV-PrlF toxin-antitoxin module|nr:AbrB/MazE/SpoVT family DNA-binding domain-containing protein [Deltaproteobacteria bacterium]
MALVRLKRNSQFTLPEILHKKLNIAEGDYMDVEIKGQGMFIKPVKMVGSEQEYFYTKEWQKDEADADKDLAANKIAGPFETVDDLIQELES